MLHGVFSVFVSNLARKLPTKYDGKLNEGKIPCRRTNGLPRTFQALPVARLLRGIRSSWIRYCFVPARSRSNTISANVTQKWCNQCEFLRVGQACCSGRLISVQGHSRPGRANSNTGHVRYASDSDEFPHRSRNDAVCRVEMWRGGLGVAYRFPALSFAGASLADHAPSPLPAHRTGRADFPHPALGSSLTPTPTERGDLARSRTKPSDDTDNHRRSANLSDCVSCAWRTTTDGAAGRRNGPGCCGSGRPFPPRSRCASQPGCG